MSQHYTNSSLKGDMGTCLTRFKKLENDRSSWRSHYMEITDYLLPRRGRYLFESANTRGRKRSSKIIDNSGGQALRTLSAGMMSGVTSPSRPWYRLTVDDYLMDFPDVKNWLIEAERVTRRLLASTNFYNVAHTCYTELGAFGTHAIIRQPHPTKLRRYRPFTAGEYVIAENKFGEVDTLGREFAMTVSQIVEMFVFDKMTGSYDWSKVSAAVKRLWENKNYDEEVKIIHMIQPRRKDARDMTRRDGKNRPVMDVYFEEGADKDVFLQEGGYDKFPAFAPRWDVLGGDVYGVSPAMEHLGDIKQLQHEQKRKAQAIDKLVNPPMVASTALKGRPTTVIAGGTTYIDNLQGQSGFAPAYMVQPRIQEMMYDIQEVQERIQRGFYADLFAMMINSDRRQITATEVAERHEEKLVLLGPVLQRLNVEMLDPIVEDAFIAALEAGMLPPVPEALQGVEINVKYVSLLAQAQEAVAAASIERTFGFAGNLSAVMPDILDNLDGDEALRQYSDILGNGPDILRDPTAVQALRRQRAEQMAAQQQAEQMAVTAGAAQQGAQAAKVLSETDTTTPNALSQLLSGV